MAFWVKSMTVCHLFRPRFIDKIYSFARMRDIHSPRNMGENCAVLTNKPIEPTFTRFCYSVVTTDRRHNGLVTPPTSANALNVCSPCHIVRSRP